MMVGTTKVCVAQVEHGKPVATGDGGRNGLARVAGRRVRLVSGQADQEVDLPLVTRSELVRSLRPLD